MHQVLATVSSLTIEEVSLKQNAADNLRLIREGLSNVSQNNDFARGLFFLRLLNRHLSLKLSLEEGDSKQIAQQLLAIITNTSLLDLDLQVKYCRALSSLLKKSKNCGISIEWRELYSIIKKVHFEKESIYGNNNGKITMKYHGHIVMQLVRRSRNYFPPTSTSEIIEEMIQYISPHDLVSSLRYMSLLNVFLPVHNNFELKWIDKLFSTWDLIENCSGWDFMMISVFSRIIKGTYTSIDWSVYSNILFTRFLRILDVGVTNSKVGKPDKISVPSDISLFIGHNKSTASCIAKCIIYMFNIPNILNLLSHLLSLLQDFYHPSNHGYYSDNLAYLIRDLPYYYSKLIYKQKNKTMETKTFIEEDKFIEILLPLVTYGLYSKSNTMNQCVRSSIKYLAHVNSSKVVSSLMNNIIIGLENVSNSNQSISMTELIATIIGEILNSSDNKDILLEQLLFISLNGIDVTDDTKTKATFKFYHRLFSYIPINSTILPSFDDFLVQFFAKVVHLLSNKDKEEKSNSSEFWWPILFKQTFRLFWFNLSSEYFELFIKKLDSHLKTSVHSNAIKEYGYILQNASYVNSDRVLQIIIPYYHKDIVKDNKLQEFSSQELIWKLSVVRNAVKYSKESIIKYKTQIFDIIKVSFTSDSKEVIRYSAKLLRSLLRSLLNRYPIDYKCSTDSNNMSLSDTTRDYDYTSANIVWHTPSKDQITMALELASFYLSSTHSDLSNIIEQGKVKTSSFQVWKLLLINRSIFLGCSELISYDTTINIRANSKDNEDLNSPLNIITKYNSIKEKIMDNLILQSIEDVHILLNIINKEKQDDTVVLKSIINAYSSMLLYRGGNPNKLRKYQAFQSMLKSKYANYTTNKKYLSRTLRIDGSLLYYWKLQNNANYGIYLSTTTKKYVKDILYLVNSNYTSVRQHALESFVKFIKQYPFTSNEFLPEVLTNLFNISSKPSESDFDTIEGILALLSTKTVLRKITSQWKLTSQFMLSLLNCVNVDKPLIQIKVFQLFMAFCVSYHQVNTKESHSNLLSNLCDILSKSAIHWKYQLMGLSWIYLIFNTEIDIKSNKVLIDIILKYSVSEITVIRYLSQRLLCKLLDSLYSVSSNTSTLNLSDIESSPIAIDKSIFNVNGQVTVITKTHVLKENSKEVIDILNSKINRIEYISTLIQLSIQDHHAKLKNDYEKRNNSGNDIASKIMGIIHRVGWGGGGGASSMIMEDSVASELINELSKLNDIWPHAKPLKLTSVGFTDVNALLWSNLFRTLGYSLLSLLVNNNILRDLNNEELEKQCILSEILAGLVRSSKYISEEHVSNMWTIILPIIKDMLNNATVEGISEYSSMLRFMCFEMDPRRLKPLIQLICYSKIISEEFTSSSQAKHILFLKSILTELNWKILQVNIDVLSLLQQNLQHPYKQVRHAIGECLSQLFINISYLPSNLTLHAVESFKSTIRSGPSIMVDNEDQNKKIQSQYRETILHWIVCSIANGDSYSIKSGFLPLLIEDIFIYQRDSQEEVSKLALHATALISQCYDKNLLIFDNVFKCASNANWHIRSAILPFLQIYVFNHVFLLNQEQVSRAINIVVQLLEDSQVEVRELARVAFSSIIKSTNFKQIDYLTNLFASSVGNKTKKDLSIQKRHAGILGYCALVEAYPYDLLEWMPPILTELSRHINDPQPIKETVKKTFQEFWRTRVNDSWPLVQNKFTEDQLYSIKELLISPSYYA